MSQDISKDMALKQAKAQLRQVVSTALRSIPQDNVQQQSSLVHSKLFALPEYHNAKCLGIFMSMPTGEILTETIVYHAFDSGKSVFIPHLRRNDLAKGPKSVMDMVELHSREDFNQLTLDKWGIPSIKKDAVEGRRSCLTDSGMEDEMTRLDMIVMPGVAFDRSLQRLGHGKGYYDFFLDRYSRQAKLKEKSMPFLVAIALQEQLLPEGQSVPTDDSDWSLDALIMGNGSILRR